MHRHLSCHYAQPGFTPQKFRDPLSTACTMDRTMRANTNKCHLTSNIHSVGYIYNWINNPKQVLRRQWLRPTIWESPKTSRDARFHKEMPSMSYLGYIGHGQKKINNSDTTPANHLLCTLNSHQEIRRGRATPSLTITCVHMYQSRATLTRTRGLPEFDARYTIIIALLMYQTTKSKLCLTYWNIFTGSAF